MVNRREISIRGADDDGNVIVCAGLSGDETIVRAGVHVLQDKEKVKIVAKESETNVGGLL